MILRKIAEAEAVSNLTTHALTQRFSGVFGYGFTYLHFPADHDDSSTHSPPIGFNYQLTPTFRAASLMVSGHLAGLRRRHLSPGVE